MATILEFSVIFLGGLRSLGFLFTRREREAIVHLWRYVGYLMGVQERILPTCEADGLRALYHVIATVCPSDDDSRQLGQALADAPLQFAGDSPMAQRLARVDRLLRIGYSRYILGDKAGDALGLPRTRLKYVWPALAPLRLGSELLRMAVPPLNRALVRRGERKLGVVFPQQVALTRADTSFTPVKKLVR